MLVVLIEGPSLFAWGTFWVGTLTRDDFRVYRIFVVVLHLVERFDALPSIIFFLSPTFRHLRLPPSTPSLQRPLRVQGVA